MSLEEDKRDEVRNTKLRKLLPTDVKNLSHRDLYIIEQQIRNFYIGSLSVREPLVEYIQRLVKDQCRTDLSLQSTQLVIDKLTLRI